MLRDAGAREVHMRISAPPIKHPCHYGIDMSTREEMVAHGRTVEEIAERARLRLAGLPLARRRLRGGQRLARPALRRLLHRRVPARGLDGGRRTSSRSSASCRSCAPDRGPDGRAARRSHELRTLTVLARAAGRRRCDRRLVHAGRRPSSSTRPVHVVRPDDGAADLGFGGLAACSSRSSLAPLRAGRPALVARSRSRSRCRCSSTSWRRRSSARARRSHGETIGEVVVRPDARPGRCRWPAP